MKAASRKADLGGIQDVLAPRTHEMSAGLAEFVVAHGFIELSVIFVAGGCGLSMGDGAVATWTADTWRRLIQQAGVSG